MPRNQILLAAARCRRVCRRGAGDERRDRALLGVTLSRYTGSGAAMLRNGGAAVRHHAAVARGTPTPSRDLVVVASHDVGRRVAFRLPQGIAIEDAEVAALRPRDDCETSDSKSAERLLTYLRSLRAMMAVGVPPLPGTRVQRVTVDDVPRCVAHAERAFVELVAGASTLRLLWFHGGAFVLCNTATHARLMSSMGVAGDARVLSVEYRWRPTRASTRTWRTPPTERTRGSWSERGETSIEKTSSPGRFSPEGTSRSRSRRGWRPPKRPGARASPAGLVLLSPWLDPGRDLRSTAAAWREAGVASVDYLRAVEASMSSVVELVFGGDLNRAVRRRRKNDYPGVFSTRRSTRTKYAALFDTVRRDRGSGERGERTGGGRVRSPRAGTTDAGSVSGNAARVPGVRQRLARGRGGDFLRRALHEKTPPHDRNAG